MILSEAHDLRIGEEPVDAVYLGDQLVWARDIREVSVSPELVWLVDENDMEVVEVTSDTDWNVI